MSRNRQARATTAKPASRLAVAVRLLEHELLVGVDHAADLLLAPFAIDFHGWTMGDERNETWM